MTMQYPITIFIIIIIIIPLRSEGFLYVVMRIYNNQTLIKQNARSCLFLH